MDRTDSLKTRLKKLNNVPNQDGSSVLYVMSREQRVADNPALLAAFKHAEALGVAPVVMFNVYPASGERNRWHYEFMLTGLQQVAEELKDKKIPFVLRSSKDMVSEVERVVQEIDACAAYFDFNPLRRPTNHCEEAARALHIPVYVVDAHNVVPVWIVSDKQEYAARTIRPKIHKQLQNYLVEPEQIYENPRQISKALTSLTFEQALDCVRAKAIKGYSPSVESGERAAHNELNDFLEKRLKDYEQARNEPHIDGLSGLSVYFHFGQLSPLRAVLKVQAYADANSGQQIEKSSDVFIEEAVIRRELSDNYCYYNKNYDSLAGAADWAKETLRQHKDDKRDYTYSFAQFESAQTHDRAWNAAQTQLRVTGKIHGYMRMYWAKKILDWTETPETALNWANKLNDKYHIDGNDPNGYVGVMWSIAGLHDRGWTERPVFGKIRYMSYGGLQRKKQIKEYEETWLNQQPSLL